jgi:hypothetical protein
LDTGEEKIIRREIESGAIRQRMALKLAVTDSAENRIIIQVITLTENVSSTTEANILFRFCCSEGHLFMRETSVRRWCVLFFCRRKMLYVDFFEKEDEN